MSVYDIINEKYAIQIENGTFKPGFHTSFLCRKFFKSLKEMTDEFLKMPIDYLNVDLLVLNDDELKATDYDKECSQYKIPVLNLKTVLTKLYSLHYNEIYIDYYLIKNTMRFQQLINKKKIVNDIIERITLLDKIDKKLKSVCKGKNVNDFYKNKRSIAESEVELLQKYLNGLGLAS